MFSGEDSETEDDQKFEKLANKFKQKSGLLNVNLKFRNYTPQSEFLQQIVSSNKTSPESLDKEIKEMLDLEVNDSSYEVFDAKLFEPKKIDWDLKRRLSKKTNKLERETSQSLDRLRKMIKHSKNGVDK